MNGAIDLTVFAPTEDMNVENEFAEGSYCGKLFSLFGLLLLGDAIFSYPFKK